MRYFILLLYVFASSNIDAQILEEQDYPKEALADGYNYPNNPTEQLRPENAWNAFGQQVPVDLLAWSKKGSNYARSYYDNGKYGMRASDGTILIPAQYDGIHFEYSGFMIAYKDGKNGVINEANDIIIPFEYKQLDLLYVNRSSKIPKGISLGDLRLLAKKEGEAGIINGRGEEIFPFKKTRMVHPHYFYDAPRESHGYIVTPPDDYQKILRGTAIIFRFDSAGVVDGNGMVLIPFEYDDIEVPYNSKDLAVVQVEKNGKHQLVNLNDGPIQTVEQQFASPLVALTDLNLNPKEQTKAYFSTSKVTGEGVYGIQKIYYGVVDFDGKTIIPFEYDKIGQLTVLNGTHHFCAYKDKQAGLISSDNEVIIPFGYGAIQQVIYVEDTPVFVVSDAETKAQGLISLENEVILPLAHSLILESNGHVLRFRSPNQKWGLANHKGIVTEANYESIGFLESNYISYGMSGLQGLLSPTGDILSEAIYKTVHCNPALLSLSKTVLRENGIESKDVAAILIRPESTYAAYTKNGRLVELGAY